MGLETSFQVSSVSTTAKACVPYAHHPFFSTQKLNLPTFKGPKVSSLFSSPSASSSSFAPSIDRRCRGLRLVCKAREAVNEVVAVTDASWTDLVIGSQNPALVEFWAPWCGPCRMIAPVIDELAKEYAGKIVCYKVNTDECPQIAKEYGIRSIPTVLLFKNGEKKSSLVGAVPKATLTATIEKYLDM